VRGWDRTATPYLEHLPAEIPVEISETPTPPEGWEAVVSTAYADRVRGTPRGEFLAQLVALRDAIVVAGAHGKTTTTAMVAYILTETGRDPAFLVGGDVPQLGGNAGVGPGPLVVEGDESDRTIELLRPDVAVVTNVDLDHHTTFASAAEVRALFDRWLASAPHAVRGEELPPYKGDLQVAGEHNRRNAAAALAAVAFVGVDSAEAQRALAEFRGVGRRIERVGEAGGVTVVDDYGHHPTEIAATLDALLEDGTRVLVLFQPHLYSRTRHLAAEFAAALARAHTVAVAEIYRAREEPTEGVDGKLIVDALADRRPGMPVAWTPALEDGAGFLARRARPGDVILTLGAGDVDRAGPLLLEALA
jgi:UDP-N-acetylmuramate--alanine ligase